MTKDGRHGCAYPCTHPSNLKLGKDKGSSGTAMHEGWTTITCCKLHKIKKMHHVCSAYFMHIPFRAKQRE